MFFVQKTSIFKFDPKRLARKKKRKVGVDGDDGTGGFSAYMDRERAKRKQRKEIYCFLHKDFDGEDFIMR